MDKVLTPIVLKYVGGFVALAAGLADVWFFNKALGSTVDGLLLGSGLTALGVQVVPAGVAALQAARKK